MQVLATCGMPVYDKPGNISLMATMLLLASGPQHVHMGALLGAPKRHHVCTTPVLCHCCKHLHACTTSGQFSEVAVEFVRLVASAYLHCFDQGRDSMLVHACGRAGTC